MKKIVIAIMLLAIIAFATSALAAERTVNFKSPTIVNGQKIPVGEYTLRYELKGNSADVQILKGKKVIASCTMPVVESKEGIRHDGLVRNSNPDGTESLKEIQIARDNKIIRFEGDTAVGK